MRLVDWQFLYINRVGPKLTISGGIQLKRGQNFLFWGGGWFGQTSLRGLASRVHFSIVVL
jgi:hypothetical protein